MISTYIIFAICVFASNASTFRHNFDVNLNEEWIQFKYAFNKKYNNIYEETMRRTIWEENLRKIKKHQTEYDLGYHTYQLGMNKLGDLTTAEIREIYFSPKMSFAPVKRTDNNRLTSNNRQSLIPDSVDWRKKGYVTEVKDQDVPKRCGSCWAFSSTGSIEGQYYKMNGTLVSFSEQQLLDCSHAFGNNGCKGGWMDNSFTYLENFKLEKESDYPYQSEVAKCKYLEKKGLLNVESFVNVKNGSEDDLTGKIATIGPISVAIDASQFSFHFYQNGVYYEPACSEFNLDHAVLAVGYGTENEKDYYIVKNSWGLNWGMDGYIRMSRNKHNQCGIATSASYPILKRP